MNTTENKLAVIYCRVSTKEQVEEGNSLVTQEKICRDYALKNGFEIVEKFIEQGESAKTVDRTELQRLLSFCSVKKHRVNAIITYKIDRISRNTDDYSQIRMLLKRYGVEIKSTSEYFENTPAGRFMENIIANVAQFDNDVRTERCVGGMRDAMREGRYVWLAPVGYSNTKISGKATITPNHLAPIIRITFEEITKNQFPLEEVRKNMSKQGLVNNQGKPISKGYFYRMIKNELYAGWIKKFGERHKGMFQPIVSDELFDLAQRVIKARKHRSHEYKMENPDFPLRRFIVHPSGTKLTGSWSKGRTKRYPYYRFKMPYLQFRKSELEFGFKSYMNSFEFDDESIKTLKVQVKENLLKATEERQKDAKRIEGYVSDLKIKQNAMIQKNLAGVLSDAILKQQLNLIEKELLDAQVSLQSLPVISVDLEGAVKHAEKFLRTPAEVWDTSPFPLKLQLQWFQFPKGILFDGEEFGTTEVCSLFKLKDGISSSKSPVVGFRNQSTNQTLKNPLVPMSAFAISGKGRCKHEKESKELFWKKIENELYTLVEIMKKLDSERSNLFQA